jgi:hypothetical protein
MKKLARSFLRLLLVLLLSACSRTASTQTITLPAPPGPEDWDISIQSVQVIPKTSIEIRGSAVLPLDGCIQTRLVEDDEPVSWWPENTCITPDTRQEWQMVVPLDGALDAAARYEIQAWWPEQPEKIQADFPFDLQSPPTP